jgi:hypothetical protein
MYDGSRMDDCLYELQATRLYLTQSARHRCLQRHDISRMPAMPGDTPAKQTFKPIPLFT